MMNPTFSTLSADYSAMRELAPYLKEPEAMRVGTPGKRGQLRMRFERDGRGGTVLRHLDRRAPLIVQQALHFDEAWPELPCVYILSSGGPHVDGDRATLQVSLGEGACAHLSTGAATKVASMVHNYAAQAQQLVLEAGAYLEYLPEPLIPCRHARFVSDTRLTVHPTATLCYAEVVAGGRKHHAGGERFAYDLLAISVHGERTDGTPLFNERSIIRPADCPVQGLGVMGDCDVFGTVIVMTPPPEAERLFRETRVSLTPTLGAGISRLPGGCGVLYRVMGREAGPVKRLVRQFCSEVRQAVKGRPLPEEFPWR